MKTLVKFFAVVASVAALASCAKEEILDSAEKNAGDSGNKPVPEGYVPLKFGVHLEGNPSDSTAVECSDTTKTTVSDDLKVSWTDGDKVLVIWGEDDGDRAEGTVKDGSIEVSGEEKDTYYAVYPSTASVTLSGGNLSVVLPESADGSWAQAGYMAAKTSKEDMKFNFKFICSVLKFKITEEKTTKMQVRSNIDEAISGTVTFGFGEDNVPSGFTASDTKIMVSSGAVEKDSWAYLPILPQTTMEYGFAVRQTVDGVLRAALSISKLTTERGDVVNLGEIQNRVRKEYYIKETASGKKDGSDWNNAGDASLLVKLFSPYIYNSKGERLGDNQKFSGTTNAWRLHQSNIYVAAGTYDLKDGDDESLAWNFKTDINFRVYGGYPSAAADTTKTGRDIDNNITTFTTSATGSNVRIFYADGCYLRTIVFDGLYFSVPSTTISSRGFILYQNSSGGTNKMSNKNALINFRNCRVKNQSHAGYGLVDINNRWSKAKFDGCVFEGNSTSSTNGGPVIVVQGCKNVDIQDCTFKGNSSTAGNGGAINLMLNDEAANGVSVVNIKDCTFEGNSTTVAGTSATKGRGGAVNILGNATKCPEVNITGCTFKNNTAKGVGGALGYDYCKLTVEKCTFEGNSCESVYTGTSQGSNLGGGAIAGIYTKSNSSSAQSYVHNGIATIKNSTFKGNNSYGRGGAIQFGNETVYLDKCTFTENYSSNKSNGGGCIFCNNTQAFINGCIFDGNQSKNTSSDNGKGGAICVKSASANTYLSNNLFKGSTAKDGLAFNAFSSAGAYFYGNTFYNNEAGNKSAIYVASVTSMYLANNTFCEQTTGPVVYSTVTVADAATFYNNIILSTGVKSIGAGTAVSMVSQGKNIYNSLSNVTLTADVGDVEGKTLTNVFGSESPSLNSDGKIAWEGGIVSGYASADDVKTAIKTASETFYNWLNDNNYWLSDGASWWPGAYQPAN